MEKNYYIQLLASFLEGNISEEDKNILLEWFEQPEAKEEIYATYQDKWNTALAALDGDIQARMLKNIHAEIDTTEIEESYRPKRSALRLRIMKYAAAACIMALVGFGSYCIAYQSFHVDNEFVVSVDKGQKATVTLPDGTQVWLNSYSVLKYDNSYNSKDRKISLEGEAYFEVAKSIDKKFVVNANGIDVEALGTSFNVKSYALENLITVTLVEGKLKVNDENTEMYIDANQRLVYNIENREFAKSDTLDNAENVSKWRDNELAFYGETLEDIATTLSRMYNVDIVFLNEDAKNYRFSGSIKNNSLHNVLNIITVAAPVSYQVKNNTIEIK